MIVKRKLYLIFVAILFSQVLCAQTEKHEHPEGERHDHYKNDIGIANSAVYFLKEKVFATDFMFIMSGPSQKLNSDLDWAMKEYLTSINTTPLEW